MPTFVSFTIGIFIFLTGIVGQVFAGTVTLKWDPNTEPDLAGYNIYFGTSPGIYGLPINAGKTTQYSVAGLLPGTNYYFAVTASDTSGNESAPSNEVAKKIPSVSAPPTPPSNSQATYLGTDTTTQGNWQTEYGTEGYYLFDGAVSPPSYTQVLPQGLAAGAWTRATTDVRALHALSGSTRLASFGTAPQSFTISLPFSDTQAHRVALYLLDWDNIGRIEQIEIFDATTGQLLDSRTESHFAQGRYLRWLITGPTTIKVTRMAGVNAVLSAVFFDTVTPSNSQATYLGTDTTTQGNWQTEYGTEGYYLFDGAVSPPSYTQVLPQGLAAGAWTRATTDVRALHALSGSTRLASFGTAPQSFTISLPFSDTQAHRVALYLLDWDNIGRIEQIEIFDATTGQLLDSRTESHFAQGRYLRWLITGPTTIKVTRMAGVNAVLSAVFFDTVTPSNSQATYLGTDTTTQGNWQTEYGTEGYYLFDGAVSPPSYTQVLPQGLAAGAWTRATTDVRALHALSGSTRLASFGTAPQSFTISLPFSDTQAHRVALYLLDWDNIGRIEQIEIFDATTGQLLDSRTESHFAQGRYLRWLITGPTTIKVTRMAGVNAVLSAVFFDPNL